MMKTLLLHLGYPKTGTTTLQGTLFETAPDLNFFAKTIRDGTEYVPDTVEAFRTLINYGTLPHILDRGPAVLDAMLADMAARREDRVLLSLEGLTNPFVDTHYTQPKDIFRKASDIRRLLQPVLDAGTEVRVLVTVRRQSELMPSLFSQIYLQGFSAGLFGPSYESFLDFMLEDDVTGFGPDFRFDAFLDHLGGLFGPEQVHAAAMKGMLSGQPCRDTEALGRFLDLSATDVITLIGSGKLNVRNKGKRRGRRMMTASQGAKRFRANTGLSMTRAAFGLADRMRVSAHRRVFWHLADHSARIDAWYAASNARLEELHDVRL